MVDDLLEERSVRRHIEPDSSTAGFCCFDGDFLIHDSFFGDSANVLKMCLCQELVVADNIPLILDYQDSVIGDHDDSAIETQLCSELEFMNQSFVRLEENGFRPTQTLDTFRIRCFFKLSLLPNITGK